MSNPDEERCVRSAPMRRTPGGPVGFIICSKEKYEEKIVEARDIIQQGRQKIADSNTVDHEFSETISKLEDSIPQKEHRDLSMNDVSKLLNSLRFAKSSLSCR